MTLNKKVYCKNCKYNDSHQTEFFQKIDETYCIVKNKHTGLREKTASKVIRNSDGNCKFYERNLFRKLLNLS